MKLTVEKTNATTWIENNPQTGETKPWEVWFQAEGFEPRRAASCKDKVGAEKSQASLIKRNTAYYNISAR